MRKTRSEKLAEELAAKDQAKKLEERLGEMVAEFDLDYDGPPYTPHQKAIFMDWAPRRYPELLKVYPSWESLPEMQRTNCVLVVKFGLNPKEFPLRQIEKNRPDMTIQAAISKVLGKEHGHGSGELFDPAVCKFKK